VAALIDTSLWIDFTRARSPQTLKRFIAPFLLDPESHLAEPVVFEILRHATPAENKQLRQQFQTLPLLATPGDLWTQATTLGQACRRKNITVSSLDLLITSVALHHAAEVVTFDDDFQKIAAVSNLRVKLLRRPKA
jgi:predicted nucleic acid-binding protein